MDLYPTSNLSEMVMLMSEEVLWQLKGKGQKMAERFFSFVKSLSPGLKYDPVTGQIVFDISLGAITQPKTTLKEIFEYLENSDVPCLVAIDEFQQKPEEIENLFHLMRAVSKPETVEYFDDLYNKCQIRYGDLKKQLAEDMIQFVAPFSEKIKEYLADKDYLDKVAKMGADKARENASKTIRDVREIIGFKPF